MKAAAPEAEAGEAGEAGDGGRERPPRDRVEAEVTAEREGRAKDCQAPGLPPRGQSCTSPELKVAQAVRDAGQCPGDLRVPLSRPACAAAAANPQGHNPRFSIAAQPLLSRSEKQS